MEIFNSNDVKEVNIPPYVRTEDKVYDVSLFENTDEEQEFVFSGSNGEYEVFLNIHQLRFCPNNDKGKSSYFLVLGTEIDQQAKLKNGGFQDFTEVDIIELKKAFFQQKEDKKRGWVLTRKSDGKTIPEFLKYKLGKVDNGKWENPRLMYALVDICAVSGSKNENIDFDKKYYLDTLRPIGDTMGRSYSTFAYGLLHTHDNYEALDPHDIKEIIQHPASDLVSERFYAIHGNMVFLRTHYPFKDNTEAYNNVHTPFVFEQLPNIYEMCRAILTEQMLNEYEGNDEENEHLRKTISDIITEMSKRHFNVKILDDKMRLYI